MEDKRAGTDSFIDSEWVTWVALSRGRMRKIRAVHLDLFQSKAQFLFLPNLENFCGLVWANRYLLVLVNERIAQFQRVLLKYAAFQLCAEQINVAYTRDDIDGCTLKNKHSSNSTLEIRIPIRKSPSRSPKLDALFLGLFIAFTDGDGWDINSFWSMMSPSRQIPTKTLDRKHVHTNHNSLLVVQGCHDFECSINWHATKFASGRSTCSLICQTFYNSLVRDRRNTRMARSRFSAANTRLLLILENLQATTERR